MSMLLENSHLWMKNAKDFIEPSNLGFYIPAYQRHFVWKKSHFNDFFESIDAGINRFAKDVGSRTFIGSMVCFHDTKYETVDPKVREDVPGRVLSIVDGQQRITTFILFAIVLHDIIRTIPIAKEASDWLKRKADEEKQLLFSLFADKKSGGQVFYPKMIRAFDDQWSVDSNSRQYHSPLSFYIDGYVDFVVNEDADTVRSFLMTKMNALELPEAAQKEIKDFVRLSESVRKEIKARLSGDDSGLDFQKLLNNPDAIQSMFNIDKEGFDGKVRLDDDTEKNLLKSIVFSKYTFENIYFTALITDEETLAFDVFESLNTTGEVLTAYETFKPEIIRREGIANFYGSVSMQHTDAIEGKLAGLNQSNEKQKFTHDLLITFALVESGKKLSKNMRDQRSYLKDEYDKTRPISMDASRNFTRSLMHTAEVVNDVWKNKQLDDCFKGDEISHSDRMIVRLCLDFLHASNHTIALALLARFYEKIKLSVEDADVRSSQREFCDVVKAISAFFALWRGSHATTDGIDARYRDLMKQGVEDLNVSAFCRKNSQNPNPIPVASDLKKAFRYLLSQDGGGSQTLITNVEDWLSRVEVLPIYESSYRVAKFLLLVAHHDTVADENEFIIAGKSGVHSILDKGDAWSDESYESVEHIYSKATARGTMVDNHVDTLGNLTLLPKVENSFIGDKSPEQKQAIYKILSAQTEDEARAIATSKQCAFLSDKQKEVLISKSYRLSILESLTFHPFNPDNDNTDDIKKRGKALGKSAWNILAKQWLSWDE